MPIKLSPRETRVAELIAQGLGNKEIAFQLGVKIGTVKEYLYITYRKLKVTNRTELAIWMLTKEKIKDDR